MFDQLDDQIFFYRFAFSNQNSQSHQRFIANPLYAVFVDQTIILTQEPDKQKRADPFIPIHKRMILDHKVSQMRRFILKGWIQFFSVKSLENR